MGKRANNPVSVLNEVEYDGTNPIGLVEARTKADGGDLSANLGTDRASRRGGSYLWDANNYVKIAANNGDISSVSALDETGAIIALTSTYVTDHYEVRGVSGEYAWNIKCWANSITPTDDEKKSYTLEGSGSGSNLFTWFECQENSGAIAYKAYANGVNGIIVNAITVPPEINPNSIHQYQDVYSWADEEGFSIDDIGVYDVIIPKNLSIILPTFKDVLGNNLQYIGACPSRAKFVGSPCFRSNKSAYYTIANKTSYQVQNFELQLDIIPTANFFIEGTLKSFIQIDLLSNTSGWEVFVTTGGILYFVIHYSGTLQVAQFAIQPYLNLGKKNTINVYVYNSNVEVYINEVKNEPTVPLNNAVVYTGSNPSQMFKRTTSVTSELNECDVLNVEINELDITGNYVQRLARWPFCEPIISAATHTVFDVSDNSNYATPANLVLANEGEQDYEHCNQNGYAVSDGVNYYKDQALTQLVPSGHIIPALESDTSKCAAYTTGGIFADVTVVQDGYSFLNTGTKLQHARMARVIQSEQVNRFWTDVNNDIIDIEHADFIGDQGDDQHFNDVSESDIIKQIRTHPNPLIGKQLEIEKRITKNT